MNLILCVPEKLLKRCAKHAKEGFVFTIWIEFFPLTVEIRATFSFEALVLVGFRWVQPAVHSDPEHCASYRPSKTFKSSCGCYITLHTHTHMHARIDSSCFLNWAKETPFFPFPSFFLQFHWPLAVLVIFITHWIVIFNSLWLWWMFCFLSDDLDQVEQVSAKMSRWSASRLMVGGKMEQNQTDLFKII